MQITQAMVFDMLSSYELTPLLLENTAFAFDNVQLLSPQAEKLNPETLYLGTSAQFKFLRPSVLRGACIVCIGKREYFEKYQHRHSVNLILLPENTDLFSVANRLFAAFERIKLWQNEVEKAILAEKSYQELAELGGKIFGENPVLLVNASYNLLGSSLQSTPYNKRVSDVLENGYYSKETTDILARMGYPSRMDSYMAAKLIEPPNYMGCPFFLLAFNAKNGTSLGFTTVYFVKDTPTDGMFDLFKFFAEQVSAYYTQQLRRDITLPTPLEQFMSDLIKHTRSEESYLIDRARVLKLPLDASYRLGVVQWEEYSPSLAHYIIGRLRTSLHFPYFKILRYQQSVLMIMQGDMPSLKVLEEVNQSFRQFSDLLKDCSGHVGFSSITPSLLKMDVAYRQACAAAKYGKLFAPEQGIHFYSTFYIYEMLDLYTAHYNLEDMFIQKLRLLQKPEEGRYSNLNLLRNYLLTERSLSSTAKLLHMHRNSVIYRLGKIQDILGIDLDNPDVRLRLLISFKILEMLDGHIQPPPQVEDNDEKSIPVFE